MTNIKNSWFQIGHTGGRADIRLFCFPYAGGAAAVYRDWANLLPSEIQVVPVELPGRGTRLSEMPFKNLPDLVDALIEIMPPLLDRPFAFFGHSMGAVIAFELSRSLRRRYSYLPEILFVSGRQAPQAPDSSSLSYKLPKDDFLEELRRLNGTSKEILENRELMELMLPLLKADFQLIQTYEYFADAPLDCPITAYGGLQDCATTRDALSAWVEQTSSDFAIHLLPGDHFFMRSSQALLLRLIAERLNRIVTRFHI